MATINVCDLCRKPLMPRFQDLGYKVSVKELKHSYDGYNPWIRKTKLSICESCTIGIVKSAAPSPNTEQEQKK